MLHGSRSKTLLSDIIQTISLSSAITISLSRFILSGLYVISLSIPVSSCIFTKTALILRRMMSSIFISVFVDTFSSIVFIFLSAHDSGSDFRNFIIVGAHCQIVHGDFSIKNYITNVG